MRRALEGPVRRWWDGEGGPGSIVLGPLTLVPSLLFGTAVRIRNTLFDHGALAFATPPIPVVSVGNLTVGGTGKTPVARWLVERLLAEGHRPALVTRGYGEDETLLHRRWNPEVPVLTAARRIEAVRAAAEGGADACVVDDGFQHRRLGRDLDILLVSVRDPLPARLLPRGPYREPLTAARRADLVLVTSRTRTEAEAAAELARGLGRRSGLPPVFPFPFSAGGWQTLRGDPAPPPGGPALIVSSVAVPSGVSALAREAGVEIEGAAVFPDHHVYREEEVEDLLRRSEGRVIVTTEKDAVKLSAFDRAFDRHGAVVRVLTLRPQPEVAVERAVTRALVEAVARGGAS